MYHPQERLVKDTTIIKMTNQPKFFINTIINKKKTTIYCKEHDLIKKLLIERKVKFKETKRLFFKIITLP